MRADVKIASPDSTVLFLWPRFVDEPASTVLPCVVPVCLPVFWLGHHFVWRWLFLALMPPRSLLEPPDVQESSLGKWEIVSVYSCSLSICRERYHHLTCDLASRLLISDRRRLARPFCSQNLNWDRRPPQWLEAEPARVEKTNKCREVICDAVK